MKSFIFLLVDNFHDDDAFQPLRPTLMNLIDAYVITRKSTKDILHHNNNYVKPKMFDRCTSYTYTNMITFTLRTISPNELVDSRYEILEKLGEGTFGYVYECYDHKRLRRVAVKISKADKVFQMSTLEEAQFLNDVRRTHKYHKYIVHLFDVTVFKGRVCLIMEKLDENLYQLIEKNNYEGLGLDFTKRVGFSLCNALKIIKELNIIHCDLKPENGVTKRDKYIKLTDFGSALYYNEINQYSFYIQTRYYRAPEVLMEINYDYAIDMWSLGCTLVETFCGRPLLPGNSTEEQLELIRKLLGNPPLNIWTEDKIKFMGDNKNITEHMQRNHDVIKSIENTIGKRLNDKNFESFLEQIFVWDHRTRLTPENALKHSWFRKK